MSSLRSRGRLRGPGLLAALVVASVVSVAACDSSPEEPPVAPLQCPEGSRPRADGQGCEPIPIETNCGAGEHVALDQGGCRPVGWQGCPAGFEADASGYGCAALQAESCDPGSMPVIGATTCQAVGWTDCPAGFEADPSGWGCHEVLPAVACTGATLEVLGQPGCQPIGDCAAAFPPAGATLFVDDSFTPGELDATHFLTVSEAIAAAPAGAMVAVASGTYVEDLVFGADVTLIGRCAEQVILESPGAMEPGLGVSGAFDVEVRGLTIRGHRRGALVDGGATLTIAECVVEQNHEHGVLAGESGTLVEIVDSVVRDTLADAFDGVGHGIDVSFGAEVRVTRGVIAGNRKFGVRAESASTIKLDRSVVRDTRSNDLNDFGLGVLLRGGTQADFTETVLTNNREIGVLALDQGTALTFRRSVIRDTQNSVVGYGRGLNVELEASAVVEDAAIVQNRELGVFASVGATISLSRVVVRGTLLNPAGEQGTAVHALSGAKITVESSALVENHDQAVFAEEAGSEVSVVGSLLAGTLPGTDGTLGRGVTVLDGASVDLTGSTILENREAGVYALGAQTRVALTSCLVRDTATDGMGTYGRGLNVQNGATATLVGSVLVGNRGFGIFATGEGAVVEATETTIEATLPQEDGRYGRGVGVQGGAAMTFTRCAFRQNREVGLFVSGDGSRATVTDSMIGETKAAMAGDGGHAAAAQTGGRIDFTGSALVDNRVSALLVNGNGAPTVIAASGCLLLRTAFGEGPAAGFGHGAVIVEGGHLSLVGSELRDNAGIALAFAASSGTVASCFVKGNLVGIHAQDGAALLETTTPPDGPIPLEVSVTKDTRFEENVTRVGVGVVPLPSSLGAF